MNTQPMIAALLTVAALLAGCGGGGEKDSKPGSKGGSVEDRLGLSDSAIEAAQAKVENDLAACMKAQGFRYTPVDPAVARAALTGRSNIRDEDFTKQFGYGIATLYGRGTDQSDPNLKIKQSLSPVDRRAYDQALTGGRPEQTFLTAADTGDFSLLGGCTKQATDAVFGGTELLATIQRKLDELDEAVLQDQRVVRAYEAWTTCMRDATGETFEDSEAVELDIQRRLSAVVGPLPEVEVAEGAFASRTPEGSVNAAALAKVQRLEVEFANADAACEEKHIEPAEDPVKAEKEARFLEDNADLLVKAQRLGP